MQQYNLPVEPQKLFSTKAHTHIKKALKAQNDLLQLAKMGDEKAIILRNMIVATMVAVKMTIGEAIIIRDFLSGKFSKQTVYAFLVSNGAIPMKDYNEYAKLQKELSQAKDKEKIQNIKAKIKEYELQVDVMTKDLLDRMMNTFHDMMAS